MTSDHPGPRVIAGSARSGTTWLLDTLAAANGAGTVFEPLNADGVTDARGLDNRYLPAAGADAQARAFFDRLFAGGYRNSWTLARTYPAALRPRLRQPRRLVRDWWGALVNYQRYGRSRTGTSLYKFIRANLMLGWLERQYAARIALVIRHPGAVIASRLRRGWPWQPVLLQYLDSPGLIADHLGDCAQRLRQIDDDVAGHAAVWAVQHRVALADWAGGRFGLFFYEDLLAGVAGEWERLQTTLQLRSLPSPALRQRASQQSDRSVAGAAVTPRTQARWRAQLDGHALAAAQRVLDLVELDLYRMEGDAPEPAGRRYRVTR